MGMGPIEDAADAMAAFILSIPFNLYSILAVMMVGLIAAGILPDFGPMKKAEERALNEGKLTRDDAQPLMADELTGIDPYPAFKPVYSGILYFRSCWSSGLQLVQ